MKSQVVLEDGVVAWIQFKSLEFHTLQEIDSFAIPFALSCAFIALQTIHGVVTRKWRESELLVPLPADQPPSSCTLQACIGRHGGTTIFLFSVARFVGCFIALGLSVATLLSLPEVHDEGLHKCWYWIARCPEIYMTFTFLYVVILAFVGLTSERRGVLATSYQTWLLLITLCVYGYRDLWPLATFDQTPQDASEGTFLWTKIAVLALTAILPPLFTPRKYKPVDPKDPMPEPNPEQICSLFSFLSYTFLSPVVFLGYRVPHLSYKQLPPLCDTDYARHLRKRAFPHLDIYSGAKREHLFFSLMRVFKKEYIQVALIMVAHTGFTFLSPVATNQLLDYIETGGRDATIRPWFWVLCVFLSPALRTTLSQIYSFIQTRTKVRAEGLLTELIFEHSFRIRQKAEVSSENGHSPPQGSTRAGTPDDVSIAENITGNTHSQQESEATAVTSRNPSTSSSSSAQNLVSKQVSSPNVTSQPVNEKGKPSANMLGRINNLLTTDLLNIVESRDFFMILLVVPLQVVGSLIFLYNVLGWSAFVGLGLIIAFLPVPGYLAKVIQKVGRERMKKSDTRVQEVTEAVNVIRMVKLFGWERRIYDRVKEKREDELYTLLKFKLLQISTQILNFVVPALTMLASYATYALVMHGELKPSIIFSSIAVFSLLRDQLKRVSFYVGQCIQGKVSLDRLGDFLHNTELLDTFIAPNEQPLNDTPESIVQINEIGLRNTSFSWDTAIDNNHSTPSNRSFRLQVDGEVLFKPNVINLIVGPTGSGKTSLLMALLGEMHHLPQGANSWFNLPRGGGVAYAAQESWVQNATIRENILFGSPYDEIRYRKVLNQCALERDLELFAAGDDTEVGEKGITLSGGQKARVTLARAIYSSAKVVLLDDVLAALDVHTSAWIVEKCLRGDIIQGRTVLLVTHNLALARSIAQHIVEVKINGSVSVLDHPIEFQDRQANEKVFQEAVKIVRQEAVPPADEQVSTSQGGKAVSGKLVVEEEIAEGRITWESIKLFIVGMGGRRPALFFSLCVTGLTLIDWINLFQTWFLGYWGSQYEHHDPSDVPAIRYLGTYSWALFVSVAIYIATFTYFGFASMRASRSINNMLMNSVLKSTLRWLDTTPTARIITRCTQDINTVDNTIPNTFSALIEVTLNLVNRLVVVVFFSPVFLFPGVAVASLGLYIGNMYLRAQLSVKRELSNARSPLLAHASAAIAGMVSIRAYGAQEAFKVELMRRIDHYSRIGRVTYNLNRWVSVRSELLGALFSSGLAGYLVYWSPISAANTGFSLNMAVDFCMMNMLWIRIFNEFEIQSNSLERIHSYLKIEHEPEATENAKPPAGWPTSGRLSVQRLSARYSENSPKVLQDISFEAEAGERIGLVGRTGSGKSSLVLALLRCITTDGAVYYDGILTHAVNLEDLRSRITVIPQTPELLSGSLRRNLDPFEEHDDATLHNSLRAAGLISLQDELGEAKLNLDSSIASSGGNLSVGQRQIIALARAMIRDSKLLILDEATSAIDYKTDAIIQHTLRHELKKDTTVITIAHRLQTIMDADKIMVLDAGKIVEYGTPKQLLKNNAGLFRAMVHESGDKEGLLKRIQP